MPLILSPGPERAAVDRLHPAFLKPGNVLTGGVQNRISVRGYYPFGTHHLV